MTGTLIRRARVEDADILATFCARLAQAEGSPPPGFDAAICRRDGFGADPRFSSLLAEIDGRPAGYALYHPSYDTDRVVPAVWLADLYVESWARRLGVGRRLAAKVASLAAAKGDRGMHWCVRRNNPAARKFYSGFAREDDALLHCFMNRASVDRLANCSPRSKAALRAAQRCDAPLLGRFLNRLLTDLGEEPLSFDPAPRLAADGFGNPPRFSAIIAEAGQEAAGHALFWPIYDTDTGGPVMFLSDLLVEGKFRGQRVAEDLMAAVARQALAAGHLGISWEALRRNQRARAFYRHMAEETDKELTVNCFGEDFLRLSGEASPTLP
jgi:GNAT superfamily N-acetyltransferase